MRRKAIVVGAGVFGASIADHLAANRWKVELIEQYEPGHARQSSGGETRLIRYSHGTAEWYSMLSYRARELWHGLERDSGEQLLLRSGVVWFAHREGGWESDSVATLARLGIPARTIDPGQLGRMFPSIETRDLAFAVHEPQGGVLMARRAVRALVHRAQRRGVRLTAAAAQPDGDGVIVGEERRRADVVVWACGPWIPRLFPDLVSTSVTQQDIIYVGAPAGWSTPDVPGWIDYDGAMYGSGDVEGTGFKVGPDFQGEPIDPDTVDRLPTQRSIDVTRTYLRRRFPALGDAPVVMTRTCQYTSTPDANWIVAPHPEHPSVWIVGAGSGHGFKHGPALGEYVGRLVAGAIAPDPMLGLGRRNAGRNLRTAGVQSAET
jgi:glycine/D-amino acid oxidase-like deaminating enzyme